MRLFLEEHAVSEWLPHVRLLTTYSDVTEIPIRGEFVDHRGNVHDHITGLGTFEW